MEREGSAKGIGFAASSHLDQVIERLQNIQRREMVRIFLPLGCVSCG
jgi:hypothetical protein